MAGETTITITGNLTRDPELRTTGNGHTVCNFTIASSTRQYNRNANQWEDGDTLFLNCTAWDSTHTALASNIASSLAKGMSVIAQGRLVQRTYETEDHERRTVMELRVEHIGPSLRRATAQVARQQSTGGFSQAPAGYSGGATANTAAGVADPFTQGAGMPEGDPWAAGTDEF